LLSGHEQAGPKDARPQILHLLCEEQSIRAVTRLTGASKNTISKLLVDAGRARGAYQDSVLRNLTCRRVQVDEIWSFVRVKHNNMARAKVVSAEAMSGRGLGWMPTPS
jgi:hypothetical protein